MKRYITCIFFKKFSAKSKMKMFKTVLKEQAGLSRAEEMQAETTRAAQHRRPFCAGLSSGNQVDGLPLVLIWNRQFEASDRQARLAMVSGFWVPAGDSYRRDAPPERVMTRTEGTSSLEE